MKRIIQVTGRLVCFLFLLNIQEVNAQLPIIDSGDEVPIDGGASLLAAAGVAYGVKKYRDYRKGTAEDAEEIE